VRGLCGGISGAQKVAKHGCGRGVGNVAVFKPWQKRVRLSCGGIWVAQKVATTCVRERCGKFVVFKRWQKRVRGLCGEIGVYCTVSKNEYCNVL
jgi:hypothetical protein